MKFKVAADMYFDQIGSNGEQVNTFQVFTYEIFNEKYDASFENTIDSAGGIISLDDAWVNYLPGVLELSDLVNPTDPFVWQVINNVIYIRAESVNITNIVGPIEGYELIIEAMNITESPDAMLIENTMLISKSFYNNPKSLPIMSAEEMPKDYCGISYQANIYSYKNGAYDSSKVAQVKPIENELKFNISPIPVSNQLNVRVTQGNLTSCTIKVVSVTGQTVIQERVGQDLLNGFAIGVEHLVNGYYILELFSDDGFRVQKKFVVQH
jgi:hypothetical protein